MPVNPVGPAPAAAAVQNSAAAEPRGQKSFAQVLEEKLAQVDALQKKADALLEGFFAGQVSDVHEVMLAMQQAELALQLAVEVRNRVIEAYQEVARMQL